MDSITVSGGIIVIPKGYRQAMATAHRGVRSIEERYYYLFFSAEVMIEGQSCVVFLRFLLV